MKKNLKINKKIISLIALGTLGVSGIVVIGTAAGAGISAVNYNEYNTLHDMYNLVRSQENIPYYIENYSFGEFIKDQNTSTDNMRPQDFKSMRDSSDEVLDSFNRMTSTKQDEQADHHGYSSTTDYHQSLVDQANLNYVNAESGAFIGCISVMAIFLVVAVASATTIGTVGYSYYKNRDPKAKKQEKTSK